MNAVKEGGRIHDFARHQGWGHQLHANTFKKARHPWWSLQPLLDRRNGVRRYTFAAHTQGPVDVGDRVFWQASAGVVEGEVYKVRGCGDPADMWDIWVRVG